MIEESLRVDVYLSVEEAAARLPGVLTGLGWELRRASGTMVQASRGRPRLWSPRIERWPATLDVRLEPAGPERTALSMRYRMRPGLHLVGALERRLLEAEAAELQSGLEASGASLKRPLDELARPLRGRVFIAAALNMALAASAVVGIGIALGHHPLWIAFAAALVALLDGLAILAFADLVLEGEASLPLLRREEPHSKQSASSSAPVAEDGAFS